MVDNIPNIESVSWSPDDSRIVFLSNGNVYALEIAKQQLSVVNKGQKDCGEAQWAPDNSKVVFSCRKANSQTRDIWTARYDGTGQTDLTADLEDCYSPTYSPDGKKIVFLSSRNRKREIYIMNTDGIGKIRLMDNADQISDINWSPDGGRLSFSAGWIGPGSTTLPSIYRIYVTDSNQKQVDRLTSDVRIGNIQWLSDTFIALTRSHIVGSDRNQKAIYQPYIYVIDANSKAWKWQNQVSSIWPGMSWTPQDYSDLITYLAKRNRQ